MLLNIAILFESCILHCIVIIDKTLYLFQKLSIYDTPLNIRVAYNTINTIEIT